MRKAVAAKPVVEFPRPDTVVSVSIDSSTGYLATADCPIKRDEFYVAGSEPSEYCPKHGGTPPSLPASPLKPLVPDSRIP